MKLIALLIGLAIERLATHLFHLRALRWLDHVIDAGFDRATRLAHWPPVLVVAGVILVLVLPVFLLRLALAAYLFDVAYLAFAVVILFFSFGPKDIAEEVDDYCDAVASRDDEAARAAAKAIIEADPPADPAERSSRLEEAVFVQGNYRLFAVIFWFVVLGPVGAWAYRASDLVRRRAVFRAARDTEGSGAASLVVTSAAGVHAWLAWLPARLAAASYAVTGSFDGAVAAWRQSPAEGASLVRDANEALLARVGRGALSGHPGITPEDPCAGALAAKRLVLRSLLAWAAVVGALTLYGWAV